MNDAPLYREFLRDAEAAAREGDRTRAFDLLGLAMDLAPADQIPAVLLAAAAVRAEVAPSAPAEPGVRPLPETPAPAAVAGPLDYPLPRFPTVAPRVERIHMERTVPVFHGVAASASSPAPIRASAAGSAPAPARAKGGGVLSGLAAVAFLVAALAFLGHMLGYSLPSVGLGALPGLPGGDPISKAEKELGAGNAAGALTVLMQAEAIAPDRQAERWALIARAHAAAGNTPGAVEAWGRAAEQDATGVVALAAGDSMSAMGWHREAADAYLVAVTFPRSPEEIERAARAQERVGETARAARVRGIASAGL